MSRDLLRTFVQLVRLPVLGAAAIGTMLATSACSADSNESARNYKIPNVLCNIDFDSALISPFLPGGDDIVVDSTSPNGGTERCDVAIDGNTAVRLTRAWWDSKESAATVAAAYDKMKDGRVDEDGHMLYSGTGGVGEVNSCTSADHPGQVLFAVVQAFTPDHDDPDAMKNLVKAYSTAIGKSDACS